jgi:hypothetical protein
LAGEGEEVIPEVLKGQLEEGDAAHGPPFIAQLDVVVGTELQVANAFRMGVEGRKKAVKMLRARVVGARRPMRWRASRPRLGSRDRRA